LLLQFIQIQGGLEAEDNYLKGGVVEKGLRTTDSDHIIQTEQSAQY